MHQGSACDDCGSRDARTRLADHTLCDRCLNDRISAQTGWPRLPDAPEGEEVLASDSRRVRIRYRLTWAPSGVIWAEAEQEGVEPGGGFRFVEYGDGDEDPAVVVGRLRAKVHREVSRGYLEASESVPGWHIAALEVAGRVEWSGDPSVPEPSVVVDGRSFDWASFGHMVAAFEGWEFRMQFGDGFEGETSEGLAEVIPLRPTPRGDAPSGPSIDTVLTEFLAEQRQRLADSTFRRYEGIIGLLRSCLNSYGHQSLFGPEAEQLEEAFEAGDYEAFTRLFGPERIVENYGEFLGYFMIRKVIASQKDLKAAGTVTKKLARWLGEHGYIDEASAHSAHDRAVDAARDLPRADRLTEHLHRLARQTRIDPDVIADEDWVEDYLSISRKEDGLLWFDDIGPVKVPEQVSELAEVGWYVNIVLARIGGAWRIVEVGMVYP